MFLPLQSFQGDNKRGLSVSLKINTSPVKPLGEQHVLRGENIYFILLLFFPCSCRTVIAEESGFFAMFQTYSLGGLLNCLMHAKSMQKAIS